uniref:LAGLIDADG endonuclease protein n=1 Tax=Volvox carteri f. nagariensis TaxID=3068 RepID=D0VMZ2_VOLCA|nr:LAGLIDADG endonuclease protein [Volvox carteri f. nagariensis]
MNTKNMNAEKWNEWFAGLTDGDGCFYINKKENSISFEVTTHVNDARVVYDIKNQLKAGTVQLRSGSQSIRYRVKQKSVIFDVIYRLNGRLYNPARVAQFKKACEMLNIQPLEKPLLIKKQNAYLAGLIDSDGTITILVSKSSAEDSQKSGVEGKQTRLMYSKGHNQISLKVTSIYEQHMNLIKNSYGFGKIYKEKPNKKNKSPKEKYHWTITSYEDFQLLYEYLKIFPLKSAKRHRMRLALLYFKYKKLNYHLKPAGTVESKIWVNFCKSWFKYSV